MSEQDTKELEIANEALFQVILWVNKENRELMIEQLAEQLGQDAAELVKDWYKIHAVNGSE